MADLKDLNKQGDGYFKEELKVDVGSFSLDMLDMQDDDKKEETEEEKNKKAAQKSA